MTPVDKPAPQDQPSPEYANFDKGLTRALATSKSEIDKREKEWKQVNHYRGRPKKK